MENISEKDVGKVFEAYNQIMEEISKDVNFDYSSFQKGYRSSYGAFNPITQNQLMKNINLNPMVASAEEIRNALDNPKNNEGTLISMAQNEYIRNMIYKRNFDYIANLLSFNLSIQCVNAKHSDYNTAKFKKDFAKVEDFINKFDYRSEFRKSVFNMLNSETYYCILRMDMCPDKYVLQDFPYQYAKITARSSHGLVADYDLSYFINSMVDINLFPKWIKKKYSSLFKGKDGYYPSNSLDNRTGTFSLWVQTSPEDGAWVFKMNPDFIANIPYFAPILSDTSLIPVFRGLQMNQSMAAVKKVVTSEWPMLKDQKGGNVTDLLAVRAETMGQIVGACARALGEAFNIINIPSEKIDVHEFTVTDKEGYSNFLKTVSSMLGGGRSIFSTDKQTAEETRLSLNIDEMLVEKMYPQFESFLDYYVNRMTTNFKFKFRFSGTNSYQNREKRKKDALDFAAVGVVSFNKVANAMDMDILELKRELEMTKNLGFSDMLMPMLNMYTGNNTSNPSSSPGAPQKEQSELTESGQETRSTTVNQQRGGKI